MPTPYFFGYPTIGTVMMGSLAIECFDYDELTLPAEQRGDDWLVESVPGRTPGDRLPDDTRRIVEIRIRGEYDEDNNLAHLTRATKMEGYHAHLSKLSALVGGLHGTTLTIGAETWTGTVTVERMTKPAWINPWTRELAMEMTIHGGQLNKAA